jgi:hypothetical protein
VSGSTGLAQMGKKLGRPESGRDDVSAKIDRAVVGKAKMIATHEGISAAELLTEILRGPIDKRYAQMLRTLERKEGEK